ncbi:SU10 major capsid protein [Nitratifractor sp.]
MPLLSYGNMTNQKPSVLDSIILQGVHRTPFLEWMGRGSVAAPKHSWILDRYREARENANLEVTGLEENTQDTKYMKDNVVQIIKNDFGLSKEELKNAKYGEQEWPYRVAKEGKEHTKDIEYAILGLHNASVYDGYTAGSNSTPAKMAGIFHFIEDTNRKHFDTNGDGTGDKTDLTYDKLSEAIQPVWERGGLEDESFQLVCGPTLKKAINRFAGDQYFRRVKEDGKFDPTLFELETDFGTVRVKIHRLFANPKLADKLLIGQLNEARIMFKYMTDFEEVPTDKTAKFGRYYTSLTLEMARPDYFACADGLK